MTCAAAAVPADQGVAQVAAAAGTYQDRAGNTHPWTVSRNHTLIWDGKPYLPVGGRFVPRYLAEAPTEENWSKDVQDLALVKGKGVLDIIVDPVVSAVRVAPEAWQRVVDYLESEGFRYGISFGAGVDTALTGTVVNPAAYRIADLENGAEAAWDVPGVAGGWYIVVDARDGTQVVGEGKAFARSGRISVTVASRSADRCVALLYPRKSVMAGLDGSLPNLWEGFDAYRDRLLQVFAKVRFGAGLRFFLDPLGERLGLPGESDYLIPDSPAWRLEWEAYLSRKYSSTNALAIAWGLLDKEIADYRMAASLVPLWFRNKGVPFLLDPSTGKRYQVSGSESRFWLDFRDCRDESMTYYARTIAEVLKREVAHVPIVYTHTIHHRMFGVGTEPGGLDGIGVAAYGSGTRLIQSGLGAAFGQVSDAARNLWFFVSETCNPTGSGTRPGYASREALTRDLDLLIGSGARGVFVRGLRVPQERAVVHASLLEQPDQLAWLRDYAGRLTTLGDSQGSPPRTLPYPVVASGYVQPGPIGNGTVWWIPSLAQGRALDFGRLYAGYVIALPEGETIVMWSLTEPLDTHLYVADPKKVQAFTVEGASIPLRVDTKNQTVQLVIPTTPILLRSQGQPVFPIEAIADALQQLRTLIAQAQADKIPVQDIRYLQEAAESRFRRKDMAAAFTLSQQAMAGIVELMQPYAWREVEHAAVHTFTEVVPAEGASQGMYLCLNTTSPPPRDGYSFQIRFRVPADDTYAVWLACSPPGPAGSPFAWVVDTGETQLSSQGRVVGDTYLGDRLGWVELGKVPLKAGEHTFTLRVTDRAPATEAYSFAADVLLVTRMPFAPRGTAKPPAVVSRSQ